MGDHGVTDESSGSVSKPESEGPQSAADGSIDRPDSNDSPVPPRTGSKSEEEQYREYRIYRALVAIRRSRLGGHLPEVLQTKLDATTEWMWQRFLLRRYQRKGTFDDLSVPEDEQVYIPAIWLVDFVEPSQISYVVSSFKKNNWSFSGPLSTSNIEMFKTVRTEGSESWSRWTVADLININSSRPPYLSQKAKLPDFIEKAQIEAWPIGESLTAVTARIELSDDAMLSVNRSWHARYEPTLVKQSDGRKVETPRWSNYRNTQAARLKLLTDARAWFAQVCPGVFSGAATPQPTLDLILFKKFDPNASLEQAEVDAIRSIGLTNLRSIYRLTSPEFPEMIINSVDTHLAPTLQHKQTWSLWGNARSASAALEAVPGSGSEPVRATSQAVRYKASEAILRLAISGLIDLHKGRMAALRDNAALEHVKYSRKSVSSLRDLFLTSSLDTGSVMRDIKKFNLSPYGKGLELILDPSPSFVNFEIKSKGQSPEAIDYAVELRKSQDEAADEILTADREYREVLSTVAALGSSMDSFRVQRAAIWIAAIAAFIGVLALIIGSATLVVTAAGSQQTCEFLLDRIPILTGVCPDPELKGG